jgi:glycosyltransferase involved in cell wall biosynthesis
MKKILIITYYWPPSGGAGVQRWAKFAKYLKLEGYEPIIFTIEDNSNYLSKDKSLVEEIKNIKTVKSKLWEPTVFYNHFFGKKDKSRISLNYLSEGRNYSFKEKIAMFIRGNFFIPDAKCLWLPNAKKSINKLFQSEKIDLIISTGPPHTCHLIGRYVKCKYNIPWIVDFRDPWTQIDYFRELKLTCFSNFIHKRLEKSVLDNANAITSVGLEMITDFKKLTKNNQFYYLPNGYDEIDFNFQECNSYNEKFIISYIGTMNTSRNPIEFWRALNILQKNNLVIFNKIKIQIVGQVEQEVLDSLKENNLENKIELLGYLNHKDATKITKSSSLLLLVINRTQNAKTILTGKLFEYLASLRPILCIGPKDGDASKIIYECEAGNVYDFDDTDGIVNFLIAKINNPTHNSNVEKIKQYSRKNITYKLIEIINRHLNV